MLGRSLSETFVMYRRRFIWFKEEACLGFSRRWIKWTLQFWYVHQCNSKFLGQVLHLKHGCKWFFKCPYRGKGLKLTTKFTSIWLAKSTIDNWLQIRVLSSNFICFVRYACHSFYFRVKHVQAFQVFDMSSHVVDDRLYQCQSLEILLHRFFFIFLIF